MTFCNNEMGRLVLCNVEMFSVTICNVQCFSAQRGNVHCLGVQCSSLKSNVVIQVIYITCSCQVFVFPILHSPHDVALIFRTCQLYTAWELLHENGGNERQAAWHW